MGDLFARIREASEWVAQRADDVRIDEAALADLALKLASIVSAPNAAPPLLDPTHHVIGDGPTTLAYVFTIDAINFGSGYFPHIDKRAGMSGYLTIATALREHFEASGPFSADELAKSSAATIAEVLGQELQAAPVGELMDLFARGLRDLGDLLNRDFAGSFLGPVHEAGGSAARLIEILTRMPLYRDEVEYRGVRVPFYKRAQITASDLAAAFGGKGPGAFSDLDRLTLFADNLVPHVLRCEGALVYGDGLSKRIAAQELIEAGSPPEVEIRAVALHAVERLVEMMRSAGVESTARELDGLLWTRGQSPEFKARPRHRTRSTFY